jgi:RNA polymerase sigma-70 factor, ECF subfamily
VVAGSGPVAVRSLEDAPDVDLLRGVDRRDEDAFRELFRRYAPVGGSLAHRIVRQSFLAEEIVQEAFLGLWRQAGSEREERASVRSWLLSMVHRRAVDCVRREQARRPRTKEQDPIATADPAVAERAAGVDATSAGPQEPPEGQAHVRRALGALPAGQRQVVEAMYYAGLSQSDVAEATGLPLGTVKSRTMLAMRALREHPAPVSTRTHDHERLEELIAADALDGLDDADLRQLDRELAAHGPECERCRRLSAESVETAATLALALEPITMSPGAADRLMAAAKLADAGPPPTLAAVAAIGSRPKARRRSGRRRIAAVVASAAALIAVAGIAGYLLRSPKPPRPYGFLGFVSEPQTQVVHFPSRGIERLAVYYQPGHREAWIAGAHISAPPDGKVYELWYLPQGSDQMVSAGTFVPKNQTVVASVHIDVAFSSVAVSVESRENPHPTSSPVFRATTI